jgi:zinc protease
MLDRTLAPPFNRSLSFDLIKPETTLLTNGTEVFFVNGGDQDVLKIEWVFKAGRWFEDTPGAAYFTSNLLLKGTASKNSFQVASIFDRYGAHVELMPGLDHLSVSLYALIKNLEPVLELMQEVLTQSVFPDKELEQAKTIYLQNLKVNNEKTSFLASKLLRKTLFGASHPYGKELEEQEVKRLTRDTVVSHYSRYLHDYFVLVSGKVSETNRALLLNHLAALPWHTNEPRTTTPAQSLTQREVVEKEGSIQSSIRIGKRFIARTHPQYYDTLILNHMLGGYFGSRLMKNIREDKGLSYGIYSSIHTMQHDSYMVIGSDVNKENLNLTFDEIRKELKRLRTEKISAAELETARNHFIGSLQSEITTPFAHADKVKNIKIFNLPQHYYQRLIQRIASITPDELIAVADTYFSEDSFAEIAVG